MRDYQKVFLKAAFNSLLPEFMDSDTINEESLSPELIAVLRKVADHYYKDEATTAKRIAEYQRKGDESSVRTLRASQLDYELVNDFFGTQSFFKDFQDQGFSTDLKMMLGTFVVKRDGDGYRITDKYDFSSNPGFVREYINEIGDELISTGNDVDFVTQFKAAVARSAKNKDKGMMGMAYPFLRVLGNQFAPDTVSPEEGGAQYVNIFIGPEDRVEEDRPSPRPTWFEDDNIEPVFPATAMDEERKSLLDKALDALFPAAEAQSNDNSPRPENDLQMFKKLRDRGYDPFPMDGNDEEGRLNDAQRRIIEMDDDDILGSLPQSKPTAKERRIASAQDQDFSDASA